MRQDLIYAYLKLTVKYGSLESKVDQLFKASSNGQSPQPQHSQDITTAEGEVFSTELAIITAKYVVELASISSTHAEHDPVPDDPM